MSQTCLTAHTAGVVRHDLTVNETMALVAGAFAAIRHADAESSRERSAHIARLILDGLRPQPPSVDGGLRQ